MQADLIQTVVANAVPAVFAITLHEAAHGYAARRFGDYTAHDAGRISLNPLRHIDPVGTVLVPLLTYALIHIPFGWAKPVPVNFAALRRPKQDMLWVAAAGPAANLFMALAWVLVSKLTPFAPGWLAPLLYEMGRAGLTFNVVLMLLNLLPLPPLDGGRMAVSLLPNALACRYARIEPYGFLILIVMLASGLLGALLWPAVRVTSGWLRF